MNVKVLKAPNRKEFDELVKFLLSDVSEEHEEHKDNTFCKDCDDPTCENFCVNDYNVCFNLPKTEESVKEPMGEQLFNLAKSIINGHRQDDYGTPEDSFQNIANYWNAYFAQIHDKREDGLTAEDVALMMVLFKIARLGHGYTKDSVVDICGYAAIYAAMHGD